MQRPTPPGCQSVMGVSILYEADRLCNPGAPHAGRVGYPVSILYEADRLCNPNSLGAVAGYHVVSILYEADRLCNPPPSYARPS